MSHEATAWAFKQSPGSPVQKFILICLADCHNGHTGQCFPSINRLAAVTGYARQTVISAIAALEQQGLIAANKTFGVSTFYDLSMDKTGPTDRPVKEVDRSNRQTKPVQQVDQTGPTVAPNRSKSWTVTGKEPGSNLEEEPGTRASIDPFWLIYPKKIDRKGSQRIWSKLNAQDRLAALANVQDHLDHDPMWRDDAGRFVPNPTTYLNQARWRDGWKPQEIGNGRRKNSLELDNEAYLAEIRESGLGGDQKYLDHRPDRPG